MLGIFDSGLGGLSVVRRVRERLAHRELLYFADQAHVPYGERTTDELRGLLAENVAWLERAGVSSIVMGCNTSCAIGQRFGWPSSHLPILDLIESAAEAAQAGGARRIGIVATSATVDSGAYTRALRQRIPGVKACEIAAPALVPLVEAGKAGTGEAHAAVESVCARLPRDLDTVILACTHYPILDAHFAQILGPRVTRLDPAIHHANRAAGLPGVDTETGMATTRYVTNGDLDRFRSAVRMITGERDPDVRHA
ncbi:MAG: glutamate racemase [Vulcanimicrobiaceae bacterium]